MKYKLKHLFLLMTLLAILFACVKDVWLQNGVCVLFRNNYLLMVYAENYHWVISLWRNTTELWRFG